MLIESDLYIRVVERRSTKTALINLFNTTEADVESNSTYNFRETESEGISNRSNTLYYRFFQPGSKKSPSFIKSHR